MAKRGLAAMYGWVDSLVDVDLLQAIALWRIGRLDSALNALASALRLAPTGERVRVLFLEDSALTAMLARLKTRGDAPG